MSRPADDAQAWADELVYQLGAEAALAVAVKLPGLIQKPEPEPKAKRER